MEFDVVVIGGGPAGMMAAIRAAQRGLEVCLLEKNPHLGRKLLLTGNGRCNLTSIANQDAFIAAYSPNGRFLYSAFSQFNNYDLMDFFEDRGVELVTEGERVFPKSQKSATILALLQSELNAEGLTVFLDAACDEIQIDMSGQFRVKLADQTLYTKNVILATGGKSYPQTGSTGDGYSWAEQLGHHLQPLKPALSGLVLDALPSHLQGLSIKDAVVTIKFKSTGKMFERQVGDILFTHYGLSGPVILNLSRSMANHEFNEFCVEIDLLPKADEEALRGLFRELHQESGRKMLRTVLGELIPQRMAKYISSQVLEEKDKELNQVTTGELQDVIGMIKKQSYDVRTVRGFDEAMLTYGGVDLTEIEARTMQSRIHNGLYFCGEILNINGKTGGFNLQAAFSTGYVAGNSVEK